MAVLCFLFVLVFGTLCPSSFAITLMGKRDRFLYLNSFMMPCDYYCSVALPHSVVEWSAVCDYSIS